MTDSVRNSPDIEVPGEPQTRQEWLDNNRSIMEQEHESAEAIFRNQIETRLREPWVSDPWNEEQHDETDVKLGNAYTACLAQYEYQPDAEALGEPWAPLTADDLVTVWFVTKEEAEVLVQMTKEEYEK